LKKSKYKCALCGKEHASIELQMPSGAAVCFQCAKDIYIAVMAIATLTKQDELKK
jgi:DNA-directed RNA polymerase subunit RPC12/RpoP